jgi:ribosomal protein S27AE
MRSYKHEGIQTMNDVPHACPNCGYGLTLADKQSKRYSCLGCGWYTHDYSNPWITPQTAILTLGFIVALVVMWNASHPACSEYKGTRYYSQCLDDAARQYSYPKGAGG